MALLRIVTYGDERLQVRCEPLEGVTPELRQLVADMGETMYAANGVGLAAPQVGVLKRLLVLDVDQVNEDNRRKKNGKRLLQAFLNPEILAVSEEDTSYAEGCLSIPGVEAEVYRPVALRLRYRDLDWVEHVVEADALLARVLQHEIDHLDGILFVDRLPAARRETLAGQLGKLRRDRERIVVPADLAAR